MGGWVPEIRQPLIADSMSYQLMPHDPCPLSTNLDEPQLLDRSDLKPRDDVAGVLACRSRR